MMSKTDHLAKAKDYIAKGEDYYRKAAKEIKAAIEEDGLSQRQVAADIGYSQPWVNALLAWSDQGDDHLPFGGEKVQTRRDLSSTRKVARENPQALIEAIAAAPSEAQAEIREGLVQAHPATAKRTPTGMPEERDYGFSVEMGGPSQALLRAIDNYVEAWDRHAPEASEEELQTERDLVAPKLLNLRMTVEGGVPA
jgi:hypothetical protein